MFLLKDLSIKLQLVIPVIFMAVLLFIALILGRSNLIESVDKMNSTTQLVVEAKDSTASLISNSYAMRISAIYALYDKDLLSRLSKSLDSSELSNKKAIANLQKIPEINQELDAFRTLMISYISSSRDTMSEVLDLRHSG